MIKHDGVSVTLADNEWLSVEDAVKAWIKHVFSIKPDDETADEWSEMANDAQRLEVILQKIGGQTKA